MITTALTAGHHHASTPGETRGLHGRSTPPLPSATFPILQPTPTVQQPPRLDHLLRSVSAAIASAAVVVAAIVAALAAPAPPPTPADVPQPTASAQPAPPAPPPG